MNEMRKYHTESEIGMYRERRIVIRKVRRLLAFMTVATEFAAIKEGSDNGKKH